ncbi:MAG TPA: hypothetical protein VN843_03080, partial [Anaerolineales bacterium]|nr:hypothetical protein [Anaerolineales bacterium]
MPNHYDTIIIGGGQKDLTPNSSHNLVKRHDRYAFKTTNMAVLAIVFIAALFLTGCGNRNLKPDPSLIQIQTPKPVIFDTDMAHEDMFAALFLLSHPNVDVKAITVSGTGEAHCAPGVAHALGLVKISGH